MDEKIILIDKYKKHLEQIERWIEKYNGDNSANLRRYLRGQEYILRKVISDLNNYNI